MAEVWRAKMEASPDSKAGCHQDDADVAQHRRELVDMFVSEASLAARLSHPNIVDVFDFGQRRAVTSSRCRCAQADLRSVHRRMQVRTSGCRRGRAAHRAGPVRGPQHIHELEDGSGPMGLIHRDLSPDNVIVSSSGTAKVIDFGAARATSRTPPGQLFVGRYRYAAPGRVRHERGLPQRHLFGRHRALQCLTGTRRSMGRTRRSSRRWWPAAAAIRAATSHRCPGTSPSW
jgi:serine/threonine-protein kinase